MTKPIRSFARDIDAAIQAATNLPAAFVKQVVKNLKMRGRVGSARPVAPPVTPRDIARIVFGLAEPLSSRAADVEFKLGRLPLALGPGHDSAEAELISLVEQAAGWRPSEINFREGAIAISTTASMVDIGVVNFDANESRTLYRTADKAPAGSHRFLTVPMSSLAKIARDLLPHKGE